MPASSSSETSLEPYLQPTWFVDSDHPAIIDYAQKALGDSRGEIDRACRLFYAVRDDIRYSAYGIDMAKESFRASHVLASGKGWCVNKSCLMAATCRAAGIPCRLGYADVRNHLATEKLLKHIGTDIFYYHGYNELFLEGRWVKATVAFNRRLCEKAKLLPLDFDGRHDSLYHPFDMEGRKHMEYLNDRGTYTDVPYDDILATFTEIYSQLLTEAQRGNLLEGDFEAEIEVEANRRAEQRRATPPEDTIPNNTPDSQP